MKRFKILSLAALVAFAACDEGSEPVVAPTVTGTVSGVVTIEGKAASGVSVSLSGAASATTDASGAYSFAGVAAGNYTVTISGYATDATFSTTAKGATITTLGQVVTVNFDGTYVRTSAIFGSVAAGGKGLAGVKVALTGANTSGASVNTDSNGQYAFTGLRAGSYTVTISGFDATQYTFASTTSAVTLTVGQSQVASFAGALLATAKITGTVTYEGAAAAGVAVSLSGTSTASATTDATGAYTFSNLTAGAYAVTISGYAADAQFTSVVQTVTITSAGSTVTASFAGTYIKNAAISGSVTVAGVGLAGVTVKLNTGASQVTDTNGQYTFTALRAGTYTVTISGWSATDYNFATASQSVTVAASGSGNASFAGTRTTNSKISGYIFIDENPNNATFEATAEDALKVAGVKITLVGDFGTTTAETDATGMFSFANLAAGTYGVTIDNTDTDIPATVSLRAGYATQQLVTITAGGTGTVNYPFVILNQAIKTYAFLGTDAVEPGLAPIPGATIWLYSTQATAAAWPATAGRLGTATTNASGQAVFRFLRANDTAPSGGVDNIVFAVLNSLPASHAGNGETVIEIKYNPKDSLGMAPDTFDALNRAVTIKWTGAEIDGDLLNGWIVVAKANKDSTSAANDYQVATSNKGVAIFDVTKAGNASSNPSFPDTLWFRLGSNAGPAGGHAFTETPTAGEGTAVDRWLRYIWSGTVTEGDTVVVGSTAVKYDDSDLVIRAHHEADDSVGHTMGDTYNGGFAVAGQLYKKNAAGTWVAQGVQTAFNTGGGAGTGILTKAEYASLGMLPSGKTYQVRARSTAGTVTLITDTLVTYTLTGEDQSDTVDVIGATNGASTFSYKFNNTQITGVVVADNFTQTGTMTPAPGFKVRILATNALGTTKDTTVTTSAAGKFASKANLLEGTYSITLADDSTNWEFTRKLRKTTSTSDLGGRYQAAGRTSILLVPAAPAAAIVAGNPGASGSTTDDNDSATGATRRTAGNLDIQFANFLATRMDGRIRGLVVNDRDIDQNTIDPGEGLAGVNFKLYKDDSGGTVSITTDSLVADGTTSSTGAFDFTGLPEGRYVLKLEAGGANDGTTAIVIGSGATTDSVVVNLAAGATCSATGDLCRTVGITSGYTGGAGDKLPRWDYTGGLGTLNRVPAVDLVRRTNFTFLYLNTVITGRVTVGGSGSAAAGMRVDIQRCSATLWVVPSPRTPVVFVGGVGAPGCTPAGPVVSAVTDGSGYFTYSGAREAVYTVTPSHASLSLGGADDIAYLQTLGSGDVQTVPTILY